MKVRGQKTNICGNRNDRQVEFHIVEKLWVITPWQTKQIKKKKKEEKKKKEKKAKVPQGSISFCSVLTQEQIPLC